MMKQTALAALSAISALAMHVGEININNKDIEGALRFDMGQFNTAIEPDTYMVGLRILDGHKDHSDLLKTDPLVAAEFLLKTPLHDDEALSFGIGGKAVYTEIGSKSYTAVPLGFEASYRLPLTIDLPVRVNGAFYYAPQVLSFSDADKFLEYRLGADVEIVPNGSLLVGYRNIDTDINRRDYTYNDGFYAGFRFAF